MHWFTSLLAISFDEALHTIHHSSRMFRVVKTWEWKAQITLATFVEHLLSNRASITEEWESRPAREWVSGRKHALKNWRNKTRPKCHFIISFQCVLGYCLHLYSVKKRRILLLNVFVSECGYFPVIFVKLNALNAFYVERGPLTWVERNANLLDMMNKAVQVEAHQLNIVKCKRT